MKRIAITIAALALSAGTAFAAAPASAPSVATPTQQTQVAKPMHTALRNSPDAKRMTKALNILEAKGYGSFNNFKADGANFSATVAPQNGPETTVVVNPDNGQVTVQS